MISKTTMTAAVEPQDFNSTANLTRVVSRKPSRVWLWFVAAFLLQAFVWIAWLVIASHHKIEEVPLATKLAR